MWGCRGPSHRPLSLRCHRRTIVEGLELNIPLEGLVDIEAEKARLDKELDKLKGEVARVEKKLSNERFVSNAPEAVVAAEKGKLAKYQELYAKTLEKKEALVL